MRSRLTISARIAALPPEARRFALTHLAHLAVQQKKGSGLSQGCRTCRDRVAALFRAVKRNLPLPQETCPACDSDWRTLEGTVPPGPPGFPILPARRPFFRKGMAMMLECPMRLLPEDEELVRIFSISRLIQRRGEGEALIRKAMSLTSEGLARHERCPWEDRLRTLRRWARRERGSPAVVESSPYKWYRDDLINTHNSDVYLAPEEIEALRSDHPEILSYALRQQTIEKLLEAPE